MAFEDEIKSFAATVSTIKEGVKTEEGTKTGLVMPFIRLLGYDPFNLSEVSPEIPAPFGIRQDQRADFGIMVQSDPAIIFEVKWSGKALDDKDEDQLRKYFGGLKGKSRVAVLTNGIHYRFFTDKEARNVMDKASFLEIDLLDLKEPRLSVLKKLTKLEFKPVEWPDAAADVKYVNDVKRLLSKELKQPSAEFIKFCAARVEPGRNQTQKFLDWCDPLTKLAVGEFMREYASAIFYRRVSESDPLGSGESVQQPPGQPRLLSPTETQALQVVRAILHGVIAQDRITGKKSKNLSNPVCKIVLDGSTHKQICRLYLDGEKGRIGFFDQSKKETQSEFNTLAEISMYAESIKASATSLNAAKGRDEAAMNNQVDSDVANPVQSQG